MSGSKYYSFAIHDGYSDSAGIFNDIGVPISTAHGSPAAPKIGYADYGSRVSIFLNGVFVQIGITNSTFELTTDGPVNIDPASKKLIVGVLDKLIIEDKNGRQRLNLDVAVIANAWYSMGYELHTIKSGMLFVRRD